MVVVFGLFCVFTRFDDPILRKSGERKDGFREQWQKYCGARFVATVFSLSFCKRLDQTSLAGSEHVEHHLVLCEKKIKYFARLCTVQGICSRCHGLITPKAKRTHISLIPSWLTTFNFKVPHVFWIGKRTINVSPSMKSQLDGLTVSGLLNCTEAGQSLVRKTLFFHFDAFHFKTLNTVSLFFLSFRVCLLSLLPWLFG